MFGLELQRRLTKSGSTVRSVVAHPGVAHTNLITHVGGLKGRVEKLFLLPITQDVEHGALPSLFAATQDIPGGSYVGPDGLIHTKGYPEVAKPSKSSRNPDVARRVWAASAELTGTGSDLPSAA
ncbi:MAG TPA: hypothetical protein VN786_04530 [Acidimicrobiales bacterium]|nr:hypothetical protein [Acidimicrobiales bacterium]